MVERPSARGPRGTVHAGPVPRSAASVAAEVPGQPWHRRCPRLRGGTGRRLVHTGGRNRGPHGAGTTRHLGSVPLVAPSDVRGVEPGLPGRGAGRRHFLAARPLATACRLDPPRGQARGALAGWRLWLAVPALPAHRPTPGVNPDDNGTHPSLRGEGRPAARICPQRPILRWGGSPMWTVPGSRPTGGMERNQLRPSLALSPRRPGASCRSTT